MPLRLRKQSGKKAQAEVDAGGVCSRQMRRTSGLLSFSCIKPQK